MLVANNKWEIQGNSIYKKWNQDKEDSSSN